VIEGEVAPFLAVGNRFILEKFGREDGVEGHQIGYVDCGLALWFRLVTC
jgi:hypothetical protein